MRDIVLLKDNLGRNHWPRTIILYFKAIFIGMVRSIKLEANYAEHSDKNVNEHNNSE